MVSMMLVALLSAGGASEDAPTYISPSGANLRFSEEHREAQVFETVCSFDNCNSRPGRCEDAAYLCVWTGSIELAVPRNIWAKLPKTFLENGYEEQTWAHGRYRYDPSPPLFGAQLIGKGTPLIGPIRVLGKEVQGILVSVIAADDAKRPVLGWFLYAKDYGVVAFQESSRSGNSGDSFWLEGVHGVLAQ